MRGALHAMEEMRALKRLFSHRVVDNLQSPLSHYRE